MGSRFSWQERERERERERVEPFDFLGLMEEVEEENL